MQSGRTENSDRGTVHKSPVEDDHICHQSDYQRDHYDCEGCDGEKKERRRQRKKEKLLELHNEVMKLFDDSSLDKAKLQNAVSNTILRY